MVATKVYLEHHATTSLDPRVIQSLDLDDTSADACHFDFVRGFDASGAPALT